MGPQKWENRAGGSNPRSELKGVLQERGQTAGLAIGQQVGPETKWRGLLPYPMDVPSGF